MRTARPSGGGWRGSAVLAAVSVALTVLGLVLHVHNRSVGGTERFFDPVMPVAALAFPATGAFIAARRPALPLAWLFGAGSLLGVAFFAEQYAVHALQVRPQAFPGGVWMAWLGGWLWVPGYLILWTLLPLVFPDGRAPSARWRPVVWVVTGLIAVATVLAALAADPVNTPAPAAAIGMEGLHQTASAVYAMGMLVAGPVCWAGLLSRHRRAAPPERSQLRWPVLAVGLAVLVPLSASVGSLLLGTSVPLGAFQVGGIVSVLAVPAATMVAIVRHRLCGLDAKADTIANRVLLHGSLAAVGAGIFVVVLAALEVFVPDEHLFGLSLVTLLVAVTAVATLHAPLQRAVDRLVYRTRHYDERVLRALNECLQSDAGTDVLLPTIVETLARGLRLPHVAVDVGYGDETTASAAYGEAREPVEVLPLVHQNEPVGRLTLAARSPEEPFDATDRRLLENVAGQVAVVAYALCLTADLQRSRERLVATREEERRRLRRDLHDGLQPALAGVTLGLEAVRNVVGRDNGAEELLGRLSAELHTASADIRRLVYDLRPPALDELGLVGALRQQGVRFSMSPTTPHLLVTARDDLSGLPAAVEVAAYRICQEALENVRKHAGARACEISLTVADNALHVEVRDDGAGIPAGVDTGVGLVAMRERAAELGGVCTVEAAPRSGTCVRAVLPLR
ncbi:MAG TPA: GAF domain-containing sensor histidine kinase [Acidimicrobiales bacterium]|nr:GAF domain-containing sensor histidine kinase [Acidimicrobiales bacterium]